MGSSHRIEGSLGASWRPPQVLEGGGLPRALLDMPEPPARLFLHGSLPEGPRVALVGTRRPTSQALAYAEFLASWLAARGVVILSGGAKGIDRAVHAGALASGLTVVVAPSSFDRPFPAKHRALFEEIVERGGGYLSRFESDTPARNHQFLERNGLLVALSDALVVVEAPLRSGARNAAKWARRLGRPYFVVPSPPWNERGRGCILELQLGARALAGPDEVLRALDESASARGTRESGRPALPGPSAASERDGPGRRGVRRPAKAKVTLEIEPSRDAERPVPVAPDDASLPSQILRAIQGGARYADEVADVTGVSLPEVGHALLLMTLSGDVDSGAGGKLTITRR
jgi:DNA processing protein